MRSRIALAASRKREGHDFQSRVNAPRQVSLYKLPKKTTFVSGHRFSGAVKRRNINAPLGADIRILGFLLNPSPRPLHMPALRVRPADTHPKRKFVVQFGVSKVEIA